MSAGYLFAYLLGFGTPFFLLAVVMGIDSLGLRLGWWKP